MSATTIRFSVVVPTYDRPRQLAACLAALARSDYPRERFEVIAVDDGSPASPASVIAPFLSRLDVRVLRQANAGPGPARNRGAGDARGRFLAFTDDDCMPEPGWLGALDAAMGCNPDHLVGGLTVNALPGNPFSTASQALIDYLYGYYNIEPGRARFFASNNFALAADAFRRIGGFTPTPVRAAAEDRDFCDRWTEHGGGATYVPDAVVRHAHPLDARGFIRQHANYGRGAVHYYALRAERGAEGVKLEPPAFYAGLLRHPFGRLPGPRAGAVGALMALSQLATAAGFAGESLNFRLGRRCRAGRL